MTPSIASHVSLLSIICLAACSGGSENAIASGGSSGLATGGVSSAAGAASPTGGASNGQSGAGNPTGGVTASGGASSPGGSSSAGMPTTLGGTASMGGSGGGSSESGASSGGSASAGSHNGGGGGGGRTGGALGTGGTPPAAGASSGGKASNGGSGGAAAGNGGKSSNGGSNPGGGGSAGGAMSTTCKPWPTASGSQSVSATIKVSGVYDGQLKRFSGSGDLGGSGQEEGQDPIFQLAAGATLKNVIIGAPAADGIHCDGPCTLQNVWWEDVGEDAATFRGSSSSQTMTVDCAGAKSASDKVLQHNGAGTLVVKNFWVDTFGKLYRSCGNCSTQYARHVQFTNITASGGGVLAGINTNYGDSAEFHNITISGKVSICDRYTGNSSGDEPNKTGSGNDGTYCIYSASEIHQQ